ncbi:MAG: carbon-nitrogen hydrolase family protein [Firmicutes bacterium]|nr:carbon-nitrogen hydrolase family protein [Bacillota bacterium]
MTNLEAKPQIIKVAAVQTNPLIGEKDKNISRILRRMEEAATQGAKLIVFSEAEVTGYCYTQLEEAKMYAEEVPGPSTEVILLKSRELGVHVVVGLLELEQDKLYNTAVLIGPTGILGKYRKTHIIHLGVDRFTCKGDLAYTVHSTEIGRIGMIICYDLRFPEPCRVLALKGTDIVVDPTNLPMGAEAHIDYLLPARAVENRVFIIAASRVGVERGTQFIGRSSIVEPSGKILAQATGDKEEIIYAELDLSRARAKGSVIKPGEYEFDIFKDRRPELYSAIVAPITRNSHTEIPCRCKQ